MTTLLIHTIPEPVERFPEPVEGSPEALEGSCGVLRIARLRDRGAVTAEKALLIAVVIMFGWLGIRFVGDPLRDPVFRVIFGILMRIYELIVTMLGGVR
jgi:hypothetical protein